VAEKDAANKDVAPKNRTDKDDEEPNLPGLYAAVQSAIWLIGLAILFWTGWWFPGILVLVAISGITQALLAKMAASEEQKAADQKALAAAARTAATAVPPNCPTCGAAISASSVSWTGPTTAQCPYCKAAIPLKSGP
jgi:cytochrome c biogenesis protein ResB